jgi:hypothetical protein
LHQGGLSHGEVGALFLPQTHLKMVARERIPRLIALSSDELRNRGVVARRETVEARFQ